VRGFGYSNPAERREFNVCSPAAVYAQHLRFRKRVCEKAAGVESTAHALRSGVEGGFIPLPRQKPSISQAARSCLRKASWVAVGRQPARTVTPMGRSLSGMGMGKTVISPPSTS
jgi:hypothetical protein